MAGSPSNLHTMDSRSSCIQGVLKVKVKGHVIRALFWNLGMSYSVVDGLVGCNCGPFWFTDRFGRFSSVYAGRTGIVLRLFASSNSTVYTFPHLCCHRISIPSHAKQNERTDLTLLLIFVRYVENAERLAVTYIDCV